jgi:hypothetical protein
MLNKQGEDSLDVMESLIENHKDMLGLLTLGGEIILNEMMFNGDLNDLWVTLHCIKA